VGNNSRAAKENPVKHFTKRAPLYNRSSSWVDDSVLIRTISGLAQAGPGSRVLDIAIGTGRIAREFKGSGSRVVGVDICPAMARKARACADTIVLTPAEKLPFKNDSFDLCVCRQGLQFMDLGKVVSEIRRVLKPGGRVVLCHVTAYGMIDKKETFFIQKLRNPARKNFFLPGDFVSVLKEKRFASVESFEYITEESVRRWINNGAIGEEEKSKIMAAYRSASEAFKRIHNVKFRAGGDIIDSMMMVIVRARKREKGA